MEKPNKKIKYDDSMFSEEIDEDLVRELVAEGYSFEEALRMVGDYDPDEFDPETCYGLDDLDRDVPDEEFDGSEFVDEEDFE
jgi:hypothetical protein